MIDGYEGGDTLCPPAPIVADSDCAIPFNLSIDLILLRYINISVLKASNFDQSIWSIGKLVDDVGSSKRSAERLDSCSGHT
ncbi:MAG: hypothetical protein CM15mP9_0170 [Methanobacteriota archaeon]|nr:MAG: hypothetical protein CM15mP9_0170 [Euryarchaeota archaeon]